MHNDFENLKNSRTKWWMSKVSTQPPTLTSSMKTSHSSKKSKSESALDETYWNDCTQPHSNTERKRVFEDTSKPNSRTLIDLNRTRWLISSEFQKGSDLWRVSRKCQLLKSRERIHELSLWIWSWFHRISCECWRIIIESRWSIPQKLIERIAIF